MLRALFRPPVALPLRAAVMVGWAATRALAAGPAPEEVEPSLAERQLERALEGPVGEAPGGPTKRYRPEDLAPYFASGPLAAAKQQFDRGRYRRARALLADQEDAPHVRFLAALAAYLQGDLPAALEQFSALAPDYPPLRDLCELYAGKAAERLGERAVAEAHYAQVGERSSGYADARFACRILEHLHLPSRPLPLARTQAPPQLQLYA